MPLTFLIVDDEQLSRRYIQDLILEHDPNSIIAGSVKNAIEARNFLAENEVEVVMLDIKMPNESGLEFLEGLINKQQYKIIIITAYSEFSIRAIKESAFDYLLKPIDKEEFFKTLERLDASYKIKRQKELNNSSSYDSAFISIHHNNGFRLLLVKDILYLKASSNYTHIRMKDAATITVSRPLRDFDQMLSKQWFFRVHKSYLVNLNYIKEYLSEGGGKILLKNGEEVYISKYKLHDFFAAISQFTRGLRG